MIAKIPIITLVSKSGPVAITVLLLLALLSIGVWAVILKKWRFYSKEKSIVAKWFKQLHNVNSLEEIHKIQTSTQSSSLTRISKVCLNEIKGLSSRVSFNSLAARGQLVQESMERAVDHEKHLNDKMLSFLALSAGISPFLGLFGTVWGIMHSFLDIGQQGSANITVVAPGIAEALVTTIIGLSVAIPASAAYNYFVAINRKSEAYMYNFSSELLSLFKRGDLQALEQVN